MPHDLITIISVLTTVGALYFYFENKKFKQYDAEREYRIAKSELETIQRERDKRMSALEEDIKSKMNISPYLVSDYRTLEEKQKDNKRAMEIEANFLTEIEKTSAKMDYYKKIKDHSIFWFLKKNKKHKWVFDNPPKNKLKSFLLKFIGK